MYADLIYSRTFSRRNGFGPVPVPPVFNKNESANVKMYRELHDLMNSLTGAEEAVICQITPLISIVRFPHGSRVQVHHLSDGSKKKVVNLS